MRQQITELGAKFFLRVVDRYRGTVVDMVGHCDAVEVDANYTKANSGRFLADIPLGEVRFDNMSVEAFVISEPGHSRDQFLHDDSLPSPRDITGDNRPQWWKVIGEGMVMNDLQRIVYA